MMKEEDWFTAAAAAAEKTPAAKRARQTEALENAKELLEESAQYRHRKEVAERAEAAMRRAAKILEADPGPRPGLAKEAAEIFADVKSGALPALGSGPDPWMSVPGSRTTTGRGGRGPAPAGPAASSPTRAPRPGSGSAMASGTYRAQPEKTISPEIGLEAILKHVRAASDEDVLRIAGEWITRVTNGITEILKSRDDA